MMPTHLVYQAYGSRSALDQTLYSILSSIPYIQNEQLPIHIVLYTDNPEYFKRYLKDFSFVHYEPITSEKISQWKGEINFIHRFKIKILEDCASKYDGHLLYLDGDTYFSKSPSVLLERIQPSISILHCYEDQLKPASSLLTKKLYKFLFKNSIYVDGELLKFKESTQMWNAGVIGLHKETQYLLSKVLKLTDTLYKKYPKHIMEQFAFSYYLQKNSHIVSCDDVVEHYWMQKEVYPNLISNFFNQVSNYSEYQEKLPLFQLPKRVYKNPYATFHMRIYQKVPPLRPLISKFNQWISSPSFE